MFPLSPLFNFSCPSAIVHCISSPSYPSLTDLLVDRRYHNFPFLSVTSLDPRSEDLPATFPKMNDFPLSKEKL